jgi:hypothetical protein
MQLALTSMVQITRCAPLHLHALFGSELRQLFDARVLAPTL